MEGPELTLRFIESLDDENSAQALITRFQQTVAQIGVPNFFCLKQQHFPPRFDYLAQVWPKGWHDRYWDQDYGSSDPVLLAVLRDGGPVVWHEVPVANGPLPKRVMGEASEFGLTDGVAFAIRGSLCSSLFISLAADTPLDRRQAGLAHFGSMYFAAKLERLLNPPAQHRPALTKRERDCLSWAAHGKTDWELSCILGISQHTATQHIRSAIRKLNTSNRAHAVAVALLQRDVTF